MRRSGAGAGLIFRETRASMLQSFRNVFKSKIGLAVTLAFVALIAFAFASMDVSNTGMFGGVSGGDRVAVVGGERIDAADLQSAANNALDQARQSDPTITMPAFIARGGLDDVLDQLLQRTALAVFAKEHGIRAGNRLVDSEIVKILSGRPISSTGVTRLRCTSWASAFSGET